MWICSIEGLLITSSCLCALSSLRITKSFQMVEWLTSALKPFPSIVMQQKSACNIFSTWQLCHWSIINKVGLIMQSTTRGWSRCFDFTIGGPHVIHFFNSINALNRPLYFFLTNDSKVVLANHSRVWQDQAEMHRPQLWAAGVNNHQGSAAGRIYCCLFLVHCFHRDLESLPVCLLTLPKCAIFSPHTGISVKYR